MQKVNIDKMSPSMQAILEAFRNDEEWLSCSEIKGRNAVLEHVNPVRLGGPLSHLRRQGWLVKTTKETGDFYYADGGMKPVTRTYYRLATAAEYAAIFDWRLKRMLLPFNADIEACSKRTAEIICKSIIVHTFENDAGIEKLISGAEPEIAAYIETQIVKLLKGEK